MKIFLFMLIFVLPSTSCKKQSVAPEKDIPVTPNTVLVDSLATPRTLALFKNLQKLSATGVAFGHQDDLAYGVGWKNVYDQSDVKLVCGDYPAVYGWDLGDIGNTSNLDGVNFEDMKFWIRQAYNRGGINTLSMHLDNPVTNGDAWDNTPAVAKILPGASHHAAYLKTLDKIAAFLQDLKASNGELIPVILRPYHEHNQTWSWWSAAACTADEYNRLWEMTVKYLRDTHQIHHLLYAISPQDVKTEADYLARYPGDRWVDVLGLDYYTLTNKAAVANMGKILGIISNLAQTRNKVAAVTETGVENIPLANWWTSCLLAGLKYNGGSTRIAWALVWRNASTTHHFAPYPGHASAPDFILFYNDPLTIFEKDLIKMYE